MAYALMALAAFRDLYRHIAKMLGWEPRYRPMRNHAFNAAFATSVFIVAVGGLLQSHQLSTVGWFACGIAVLGGTTVPCGWPMVNDKPWLWNLRQLFFLTLGAGILAYALGVYR